MSLVRLYSDTQPYADAFTQASELLDYPVSSDWRRGPDLWVVQGPGENWDEVTEEFQRRPIQAILTIDRYGGFTENGPECSIAVSPANRRHGLATRLLRWVFTNQSESIVGQVNSNQQAGLAFAAKHGQFVQTRSGMFLFRIDVDTTQLAHIGCYCRECQNDLDFTNV